MSTCPTSCSITIIFIISLIYMSIMVDKCSLDSVFINTLNSQQQIQYKNYVKKRQYIYYGGIAIGIILSLMYMKLWPTDPTTTKMNTICKVGMIIFISSYFFYVFYPKDEMFIIKLSEEKQRVEWVNIYKKMQFHRHIGILIGFLIISLFSGMFCPL